LNQPAIVFDHITKSFPLYSHFTGGSKYLLLHPCKALTYLRQRRFEALKNLSFVVEKGESFGIIGRNGAGKSTMLGLVAGVLSPTSGTLEVNGRVSPFLELGAGFHPDLTGKENIMLNGALMGLTRSEIVQQMNSIIEFSELDDFINQPVRTYSSGMLSRLGFSVVAHLDPEILLVDEVFAVGDIGFENKCVEKMKEFKRKGVTIVLVSHQMKDIETICNRVAWIDGHTIKLLGKTEEVVSAYVSSWNSTSSSTCF
jgi:lipopolysaccharide transport system ATP-binding protein